MNVASPRQRVAQLSLSWARFHVRDLALAALFIFCLTLPFNRSTDPDYWWHLAAGERIFAEGAIPREDSFSWTAAGKAWVDHEWLSQVAIHGLQETVGYPGALIFFTLAGLGGLLIAYQLMRKLGVPEALAIGATWWGGVLIIAFLTVRPAVFSILLGAAFLSACYQYRRRLTDKLWNLPVLMILWANLHGGYVIGLGLLGLLLVAELIEERGRKARRVAYVLGLTFLAAGLNPYTYKLWLYPFTYFLGDNASLQLIREWQTPPFFHNPGTLPLAASILALVAVGARRGDFWRTGLLVIFTALVLQSWRHQALFALVFPVAFAEIVASRWPQFAAAGRRAISPRTAVLNLALAGTIAAVCAAAVIGSGHQTSREAWEGSATKPYPVEGANFVAANYAEARIFNEYVWGGYLIHKLPETPVYIDGRADLYGKKALEEYASVIHLEPGWAEVLDKQGVTLAFIDKESSLAAALEIDQGWREVFSGEVERVFVRAELAPPGNKKN